MHFRTELQPGAPSHLRNTVPSVPEPARSAPPGPTTREPARAPARRTPPHSRQTGTDSAPFPRTGRKRPLSHGAPTGNAPPAAGEGTARTRRHAHPPTGTGARTTDFHKPVENGSRTCTCTFARSASPEHPKDQHAQFRAESRPGALKKTATCTFVRIPSPERPTNVGGTKLVENSLRTSTCTLVRGPGPERPEGPARALSYGFPARSAPGDQRVHFRTGLRPGAPKKAGACTRTGPRPEARRRPTRALSYGPARSAPPTFTTRTCRKQLKVQHVHSRAGPRPGGPGDRRVHFRTEPGPERPPTYTARTCRKQLKDQHVHSRAGPRPEGPGRPTRALSYGPGPERPTDVHSPNLSKTA